MMIVQNSQYLESKVLTAPPHRLHLILLEGAIRFGRQAETAMLQSDFAAASEPLDRLIDIVGELLAGVRGGKTNLNVQIARLYLFLFRTVVEAKLNDDVERLRNALKLLELERETWQLVCEKLTGESNSSASDGRRKYAEQAPGAPHTPLVLDGSPAVAKSTLSIEA